MAVALLLGFTHTRTLAAEEEASRFCVGMIYCKETKAGTTSTTAFLWLYSTEERGTFSRFTIRPFYSRELDPVRDYFRRSVLWPLGIAEREGPNYYSQILPFYWHAERPNMRYTFVVPLYSDYAKKDRRYTWVIPLYGHHQRGDSYDQYFILGPLAIATFDTQEDRQEWDILFPFFHRGKDKNGFHTRFLPLYFAGENRSAGTSYRHLIPLYGASETPQRRWHYAALLYGHLSDETKQETRTSILGLPPFPTVNLPALSLYERIASPERMSTRVFPLYRYAYTASEDLTEVNALLLYQSRSSPNLNVKRLLPLWIYEDDRTKERMSWSFLGYGDWSFARYLRDPQAVRHHVIPLYRLTEDIPGRTRTVDALGLGPLSLYRYHRGPDELAQRVFPLYTYDQTGAEAWRLSVVGAGPLAVYRHTTQGDVVQDRFFPLHEYRRNGEWREFSLIGASSLAWFRYESGPTLKAHRLLPLWGYRSTPQEGWRLALLGGPPREGTFAWSLYEHAASPTYLLSRVFPLYRLESNKATKEWSLAALLLYHHSDSEVRLRDRLWPLHEYERNKVRDTSQLYLLGVKPLTLFRHTTGPDAAASYFVPLYDYDRDGESRRMALLGLPKVGTAPTTWSLFERVRTPSLSAHRFFPLYRYRRDDAAETRDWGALLLWWHRETKQRLRNIFVPLADILHDKAQEVREVGVLGIRPLTMFKYRSTPTGRAHSFALLYGYEREGDRSRFSALGLPTMGTLPALSLFAWETGPSLTAYRLFPAWAYERDEEAKRTSMNILFLFWRLTSAERSRTMILPLWTDLEDHQAQERALGVLGIGPVSMYYQRTSPVGRTARIFPLFGYRQDRQNDERHLGILGVPPLSLYYGFISPKASERRLFPLFRYTADHVKDEAAFSLLWPLYDYRRVGDRVVETSVLWWLFHYRSLKPGDREYWVIGYPPVAFFVRTETPQTTSVEINPVIPLWWRESVEGRGTSWALFGGLVGVDALQTGERKLRLFWVFRL